MSMDDINRVTLQYLHLDKGFQHWLDWITDYDAELAEWQARERQK